MNSACPTCGADLLKPDDPYLAERDDGWLEVVEPDPDPVPYDESMRGPRTSPDDPIGGLWFCSEACRDEYRDGEADE